MNDLRRHDRVSILSTFKILVRDLPGQCIAMKHVIFLATLVDNYFIECVTVSGLNTNAWIYVLRLFIEDGSQQ